MPEQDLTEKFGDILTEEQLAILDQNKANSQELREAFKATLSEEQLAVLENTELNRREQREALRATLSDEQRGSSWTVTEKSSGNNVKLSERP